MSRPSARLGWRRARACGPVVGLAAAVELALTAPLAWALGLDLAAATAHNAAGREILLGHPSEGLGLWLLRLADHAPALAVAAAATLLAAVVWRVAWQGGLALVWAPDRRPGAGRTAGAGAGRLAPLAVLALAGGGLQALLVGAVVGAGLALPAAGPAMPWWAEPARRAAIGLAAVAAWLPAAAAVQRGRWLVAAGRGPLAALAGGIRAVIAAPAAETAPVLAWSAWSLAWAGAWAALRAATGLRSPLAVALGFALLGGLHVALAWGRAALVLSYAPPPDAA